MIAGLAFALVRRARALAKPALALLPSNRRSRVIAGVAFALVPSACVLHTPLGELPPNASATGGMTSSVSVGEDTWAMPSTTGDTVGMVEEHAFTMRYDEWEAAAGGAETSGNSGGTGGPSSDTDSGMAPTPDTLVVQISTGPDDCNDPHASLECRSQWSIVMLVPPAFQAPGTYNLATELSAFVTIAGEEEESGVCSFGAGTAEGTAELLEVSPQQVIGQLSLVDPFTIPEELELVAPRCQ